MASIREKIVLEITDGPTFRLITEALRRSFCTKKTLAKFSTRNNTYMTTITGVVRKDRTTLNLVGKIDAQISSHQHSSNPNANFSGEYSTKSKTGRFTFYIDYDVPGPTITDDDIKQASRFAAEFDAPRNDTT